MVFGTCCIALHGNLTSMEAKSFRIEGFQRDFIVNFEVTQTFIHSEKEAKEVHYIFPNDLKICIYDTTFVVGEEIIKPKLKAKEEAKKTYREAVKSGRTAVLGYNIGRGMTGFKLGNVQPNVECKVILKIAFTAQLMKEKTFFIKFPLDIYTPGGSKGCIGSSNFSFKLQSDKEKISKITSNVKDGLFDETEKLFSIKDKVESNNNEKSIIISFESKEDIQSSALLSSPNSSSYNYCALLISPSLPPSKSSNSEFVFIVDCSGSMWGKSITKTGECLELFIRSLPQQSFFNIIRFGSQFTKLFNNSEPYNDQTAGKAIELARTLKANLGGTKILQPLKELFQSTTSHGQRQIFIITDGEVNNTKEVLNLISSHKNKNRIFTVGVGRGCDAGLVEGMAKASGGKSDFVQEGDSISEKVIPQLNSSLYPSLNSIEIHVEGEGNDDFEVSPFPLPSINANGSSVVYLRGRKKEEGNPFERGFMVTGSYGDETVEIPIVDVETSQKVEEDKFGCSKGENVGEAILPLFAFSILSKFERMQNISEADRRKATLLSLSSRVLCKFTGLVGVTEYHHTENTQSKLFKLECQDPRTQPNGGLFVDTCNKNMHQTFGSLPNRGILVDKYHQANFKPISSVIDNSIDSGRSRCMIESCGVIESCGMIESKKKLVSSNVYDVREDDENETDSGISCDNDGSIGELVTSNVSASKNKIYSGISSDGDGSIGDFVLSDNESDNEIEMYNEKPIKKKIQPVCYDLLAITNFQKISGYWQDLKAVQSLSGVDLDHIDEITVSDKNIEKNCIATILAIATIRVKSANEMNSWSMIVQKGIDWLKKTLPNVDIEKVIVKIEKLISK